LNKTWRKLMITGLVAGLCVVLLSGLAGAAGRNPQGFNIGQTMGGLRAAVASVLGIETEEFIQARQEGKTLREILEENDIDVDNFVQEQVAVRKAVMDQLVAEGKMTAEQAETCLANLSENLDTRLDSNTCTGLGQGGLGGRGCGGQGRGTGRMMRGGFGWGK